MNYWRTQFLDACMLAIVPAITALLPWPLGWRWLRYWARKPWSPFTDAARAALSVAEQRLPIADPRAFRERMRLLLLMDCCDLYKSILCPRRARLPRYTEQAGSWPDAPAFVAVGFHYGVGLEIFRTLAAANHDCTFVSRQWRREDYPHHPVRYWYGRLRAREIVRIAGRPVTYRPGIRAALERTLRENAVVLALIDLPAHLAPRGRRKVTLLGRESSLPGGMIELAREAGVPVVPYWVEFDEAMYRRRICIGDPIATDDVDAALTEIASILDRCIRAAPHAWTMWPELPGWDADETGATSTGGGSADDRPL